MYPINFLTLSAAFLNEDQEAFRIVILSLSPHKGGTS